MSTITPAEAAGREIGTGFQGQLIGPGDAAYDEARTQFNAMIDKRPAVIARGRRLHLGRRRYRDA